jgi:DNA-binding SARP family transcriptional activator
MEFRLLGPLELVADEGRPIELPAGKPRLLLALLLLDGGRVVSVDRIVAGLWGEQPPATAAKVVQGYVSRLRRLLPDGVLLTRAPGYLLRVEDEQVDLRRFERLRREAAAAFTDSRYQGAAQLLQEGLALSRGPPLADFQYESSARDEIGRLEELGLVAFEQRLEVDLALGRHAEIVGELEALVRNEPLRERPPALLMIVLYRTGRQADALAVYQETRARLMDELGLDPKQALQELEKAILRQDPALELVAAPQPEPEAPALASTPPHEAGRSEERKTVTVLFCELEARDAIDPESLRLLTTRFLEQAGSVVAGHGSTLDKLVGDEVMVVFGVPFVREDDALRAVRSALELRDLAHCDRGGLRVRIGITTGEVFTGTQDDVTDGAVSAAKRLAYEAAWGHVVLGSATYGLVAHAVQVEPQGDAFQVEALDPEATAVRRRDDSRFVGRERELERLCSVYAGVVAGSGARLVTIVGEPGIGKSRLARQLLAALDPEPTVLVGRCPPYGEGVTFWPLRELIRQAGRDESELAGSSHEVFATVRRLLLDLAVEQPVVVAFDDVHWAEPTFLDLVEYVTARLGDARVLLLCLARPQFADQRPAWLQRPQTRLSSSRFRKRMPSCCSSRLVLRRTYADESSKPPRAIPSSPSSSRRSPTRSGPAARCRRRSAASCTSASTGSNETNAPFSSVRPSRGGASRSEPCSRFRRRTKPTVPRSICTRSCASASFALTHSRGRCRSGPGLTAGGT